MVDVPDSLELLFKTQLEDDGDQYVVSIPKELVDDGSLAEDATYRVALMAAMNNTAEPKVTERDNEVSKVNGDSAREIEADPAPQQSGDGQNPEPPVEEGEVRSVYIDALGDKGDGIAKVERGFVIIVPGTKPGDHVDVEITKVKETVAFAEPVSEPVVQ